MPQPSQHVLIDLDARASAAAAHLKIVETAGQIDTLRAMAEKHDKADEERTIRLEREIEQVGKKIDSLSENVSGAVGRVHARIDALVRAALTGAMATAIALAGAILYELWTLAQAGG
ncbi:hypothetical protein EOI86_07150 [Hwanghaeella grinnelliae]|uniref:DUF1515 domain-containing protein n=1 Tax=Hwanghaeella grinnelliae TaxID=2500179 RepID=A0A3S2VRW1_9PROT|nr:hypothetical protein [Hwanghaeella grinnelliae]RVU39027.1 hypothetical protein EOI86_07150 [Hwanghaeella grinnelliae]